MDSRDARKVSVKSSKRIRRIREAERSRNVDIIGSRMGFCWMVRELGFYRHNMPPMADLVRAYKTQLIFNRRVDRSLFDKDKP